MVGYQLLRSLSATDAETFVAVFGTTGTAEPVSSMGSKYSLTLLF